MSTVGGVGAEESVAVTTLGTVQEDAQDTENRPASTGASLSATHDKARGGRGRASLTQGNRQSTSARKPSLGYHAEESKDHSRRSSVLTGKGRRRSTRSGSKMYHYPRRQSQKVVHMLDKDGNFSTALMEDPPEAKSGEEVQIKLNGKRGQATKYKYINKEDLKVQIYQEYIGRRAAFDLGKARRKRTQTRQKKALEAHKARGKIANKGEGKKLCPAIGRKNTNDVSPGRKQAHTAGPVRTMLQIDELHPEPPKSALEGRRLSSDARRASLVAARRTTFAREARRASIMPDPEGRRASVIDYGNRRLLPSRPQMDGSGTCNTDDFELNYHGMTLMNREQQGKKSMMDKMNSIEKKPSNCKILVPTKQSGANHTTMSHMSEEQIKAFREVFDLFDGNGGGTIDAEELDLTLRSVEICLTKDEINEILHTIDKDGNGEIDFDEFLLLMTNTERFLETIANVHNPDGEQPSHSSLIQNENRLFEAFTEFMKKSAINSIDEIEDYYDTKVKRFQTPHVVNHYAAGARLIGLTEKQLKEHLDRLNATNASADGMKSPYAQPLSLVVSNTPPVTKKNKKKTQGNDEKAGKKRRGVISLKIKFGKVNASTSSTSASKAGQDNKSISPRNEYDHQAGGFVSAGWLSQRTEHAEVRLPHVHLQKLEPFDELSADDLPFIHEQTNLATREFWREVRRTQWIENLDHWDILDADLITPAILRHHFRDIFSHYTTINRQRLDIKFNIHRRGTMH